MGHPARAAQPSIGRIVVWYDGVTHGFASPEEARAHLSQPLSDAEVDRGLRALDMAEALQRDFVGRSGGGLSEADIEDALRAASCSEPCR
jgi:hypothetical protein